MRKLVSAEILQIRNTYSLVNRCIGVLFVYTFLFELLKSELLLPIGGRILSIALRAVPDQYVSDVTVGKLLAHPLTVVVLFALIVAYAFLCLRQISGMLMCLEYGYRGEAVHLLKLYPASFRQIEQTAHPKNWMIFVCIMIIQPLFDARTGAGILSDFRFPEFLMEFIYSRTMLTLLFRGILLFLFVCFLRFLFVPEFYVLKRWRFKESAEKSRELQKNGKKFLYLSALIVVSLTGVIFYLFPLLALCFFNSLTVFFMRDCRFVMQAGSFAMNTAGRVLLYDMGNTIGGIVMAAFMVINFHEFLQNAGEDELFFLPRECTKREGKIRSLKGFIVLAFTVACVSTVSTTVSLTLLGEHSEEQFLHLVFPTKIISHKGLSTIAPENTIAAFELAVARGSTDMIELDVRSTKDGVPVVLHDESLLKATGEKRYVYDLTYGELKELNAPYTFRKKYPEEKIPTLEEVFERFAGKIPLLIEIKASAKSPDLTGKVVELMEIYHCTDTCRIQSGTYEVLREVKELDPDILCGLIMTMSVGAFYNLPDADFFSVEHTFVSTESIDSIHSLDKELYVWTVNRADSLIESLQRGVDGVITDYPKKAYEVLYQTRLDPSELFKNTIDTFKMCVGWEREQIPLTDEEMNDY